MTMIAGRGAAEVRRIAIELRKENEILKRRVTALEATKKVLKEKSSKVTTRIKIKTKTENLPMGRKVKIGKAFAQKYIKEKVKGGFNTKISDISRLTLKTADFCAQFKLSPRQLGVLLHASNFVTVRRMDLYEGNDVGNWYSQTVEALFTKGLIIRTNNDMVKWVYFTLAPTGERLVRAFNERIKEYINE